MHPSYKAQFEVPQLDGNMSWKVLMSRHSTHHTSAYVIWWDKMRYDYYNISSDSIAETGKLPIFRRLFFLFFPQHLWFYRHTNMNSNVFNFRTRILFFWGGARLWLWGVSQQQEESLRLGGHGPWQVPLVVADRCDRNIGCVGLHCAVFCETSLWLKGRNDAKRKK